MKNLTRTLATALTLAIALALLHNVATLHAVTCVPLNYTYATWHSYSIVSGVGFSGGCASEVIWGFYVNVSGFYNMTGGVYFKNIDFHGVEMDMGAFAIGANVTITGLSGTYLSFYATQNVPQYLLVNVPQYWKEMLQNHEALIVLWLPNITKNVEKVYVNGHDYIGARCTSILMALLAPVKAFCYYWNSNTKLLVIKLPFRNTTKIHVRIIFGSGTSQVGTFTLHAPAITYARINVTYSPQSLNYTLASSWTINASTTYTSRSGWMFNLTVVPYYNNTGYVPVDKNATILGTWLSGTVSDLSAFDYRWMLFQTYNKSNTMIFVATFNVTTLGWLASDPTLKIRDIVVKIAGNVSKVVNTKASLEILNWCTGTWETIDNVALNQTVDTEKTYHLATVFSGTNLRCFISSSGVVAFRINVTDVQTYPSTYVDVAIDELKVLIDYGNETHAVYTYQISIVLPPNFTAESGKVTMDVYTLGTTGGERQLSIALETPSGTLATWSNVTFSAGKWTRNVLTFGKFSSSTLTLRMTMNVMSNLTQREVVAVRNVRIVLNGTSGLSIIYECYPAYINARLAKYGGELYCVAWIPLTQGFTYVNASMLSFRTWTWYRTVLAGSRNNVLNTLNLLGNATLFNVSENGIAWAVMYEKINTTLTKLGTAIVHVYAPVGTVSKVFVYAPSGQVWATLPNNETLVGTTTLLVPLLHTSDVASFELWYGRYFTGSFYTWVNMSNPSIVIRDVKYNPYLKELVIDLDAEGLQEVNVRTGTAPTSIVIWYGGAKWTPTREIDYESYLACRPPCWYYDPQLHVLRIKFVSYSPVRYVITFQKPIQVPKIQNVTLQLPNVVQAGSTVIAKVLVGVWSSTDTDMEVRYTVRCLGPTLVKYSGDEVIHIVAGVGTYRLYAPITFTRAGEYTCTATVNNVTSRPIIVTVVPTQVPHRLRLPSGLLLILAVFAFMMVIVALILMLTLMIRHHHHSHMTGTGRRGGGRR